MAESISRPKGDPHWNYLRFFDNIRPYIWMKPIGNLLYECVYLAGHPALTTSNSDDPPGSFHSKDVFTPHPTIPDRWKYVSRLDDRITLVNGEKVLPLPIEGHIKQHPFIHEAVVVGLGQAAPGLLVFRAEMAAHLPDEQYLDTIWSTVEDANSRAERFSQISRDMIVVLPHSATCPRTDKGSMIRAQVYQQYSEVINRIYDKMEQVTDNDLHPDLLHLDLSATQSYLLRLCRDDLGVPISGIDADFYAEGVDSLKAIHLRRLILRRFKFAGHADHIMCRNVVYETGSISRLAHHICDLQSGENISRVGNSTAISSLVSKYSKFRKHIPRPGMAPNMSSVVSRNECRSPTVQF